MILNTLQNPHDIGVLRGAFKFYNNERSRHGLAYFKFKNERIFKMIKISKEQAAIVRKNFPYVHIKRTVNKYYMEEDKEAMNFISQPYKKGIESIA